MLGSSWSEAFSARRSGWEGSDHTPEQIITALREAEVGLARGKSVKLISRELGITEPERTTGGGGSTAG